MRTRVFISGLLLVIAAGGSGRLLACGDKYLNLGLRTHYDRSTAERKAAGILVYAAAGSDLSRTLTTLSFDARMKKEGYQPVLVASDDQLATVLRSRKWDVIVVEARHAEAVRAVSQRIPSASGPHVVPVLTSPTKEELNQAKKFYRTVINTPTRSVEFVDMIEDAMDLHEVEAAAATKAAKKAAR